MISSARWLIFSEGLLIGKADERMHNNSSLPFATCKTISDVDVSLQLFLYNVEIEIMALVEHVHDCLVDNSSTSRSCARTWMFHWGSKSNSKWINYIWRAPNQLCKENMLDWFGLHGIVIYPLGYAELNPLKSFISPLSNINSMYCYCTVVGVILAHELDFMIQMRQFENSEFTME